MLIDAVLIDAVMIDAVMITVQVGSTTLPAVAESRPQLSAVEQRVLGALLEKQRTVPASYPLTPNALRAACNQASSREPVTDYDDSLLQATLKELRDRELVRPVWTGAGSRVVKFHQRLGEHSASVSPNWRC